MRRIGQFLLVLVMATATLLPSAPASAASGGCSSVSGRAKYIVCVDVSSQRAWLRRVTSGVVGTTVTLGANVLTAGDASDTTFAGVIGGTGGLVKQGVGSLTLSGANTYSGGTTISSGTLAVSGATASAGSGPIAVGPNTLDVTGGANLPNTVSIDGGTIANSAGTGTVSAGGVLLQGNAVLSSTAGGLTISATIDDGTNTFELTKTGAGTVTLSGANTFGGGVTISAGSLALSGGAAIADTLPVNLDTAGANLTLVTSETIGSLSGVAGTTVNLGANTLATGQAGSTSYAGVIGGTGGLVKQGAGTFTLTDANTYSGGTTIAAGTLAISPPRGIG